MEIESIEISTFGKDSSIIKEFIDSCVEHCMVKDDGLIGIHELHRWGIGWTKVQSKQPRALESVILEEGTAERFIQDIKDF